MIRLRSLLGERGGPAGRGGSGRGAGAGAEPGREDGAEPGVGDRHGHEPVCERTDLPSVIPTHPMRTPDPGVLRWVVPDGLLPFTGRVERAPALLQSLLDDGTLAAVQVVPGAVLTLLGDGRDWAEEGSLVRSALVDALGAPQRWVPVGDAVELGPDDVLEAAAHEIAAGPVDEIASLHGGSFRVASVADGVVTVALDGSCRDCPAAGITMHARFEHLLRRRCPWLVEVREGEH